jgi:hypothetical protein
MKKIYYLIGLTVLIIVLWNLPVLYPLKLLVVFFHESSHALATILTGGEVTQMVIVPEQGGYVMSRGGNRFIVLNSGYLGSLLWGAFIFLWAARSKSDKTAMTILGIIVGLLTLWFVSNLFALGFGILTGIGMIVSGRYLSPRVNDFILHIIGLTGMIYAPLDIFSDTIDRSHLISDASMLATEYGGFTMLWGGIWIVLSLFTILTCMRWSMGKKYSR